MTALLRKAGALAPLLLASMSLNQQTQGPPQETSAIGTAFILGRTVDGSTGKPIGGAIVSLNSSGGVPNAAAIPGTPPAALSRFPIRLISDGNGNFIFRELPKGGYTISATKAGYAQASNGVTSASAPGGGQVLLLEDGEKRSNVDLKFWKFASISGRVVDEAGEPVIGLALRTFRRAVVGGRLRYTSFGNQPTTDDRGVYRASQLTPGDYIIGIVTTQATVPTALQDAATAADKDGSGTEFRRQMDRSGQAGLGSVNIGAGRQVDSWVLQFGADLGMRTSPSPPGDGDRVYVYPTVFHPAATTITSATVITLNSGDDRLSVDFRLKPVITSRVAGRLAGPETEQAFTTLSLLPVSSEEAQRDYDMATATTVTDRSGAFVFLGVPPGDYIIRVLKAPPRPVTQSSMTTVIQTGTSTIFSSSGGSAPPPPVPDEPTWWAQMPVNVADRDVSGVTVTLHAGARVTGRLEFDGAAQKPTVDQLRIATVTVDPADGRSGSFNQFTMSRGVVDQSGQFKTYQLPAGRYVIRASAPVPGWSFKGASLGGRDVSDTAFEIGSEDVSNIVVTFTDRPSELTGTVSNGKGPDATATVLAFPSQPAMWTNHGAAPRRFRATRAGQDGTYRFANLLAGDYLIVSVTSVSSEWLDPQFLQKLTPLATLVTIADGDKKSQDLTTKEVRR